MRFDEIDNGFRGVRKANSKVTVLLSLPIILSNTEKLQIILVGNMLASSFY